MIKNLIIRYAKGKAIDALNSLLEKNKTNVEVICQQIHVWTLKLQIVIEQLKRISSRCEDGHIDDKEVDDSLNEIEAIIREW